MKLLTNTVAVPTLAALGASAVAQTVVDGVNLTLSPASAGNITSHPDVSDITPRTNSSEIASDPFVSGKSNFLPEEPRTLLFL